MLTEFGGIAYVKPEDRERTWGYSTADDAEGFYDHYQRLLEVVNITTMFSGFCYTQFADTFQESNGLLYADRTPKIPFERISAATRGMRVDPNAMVTLGEPGWVEKPGGEEGKE
jgi:hypothetical protein